MTRVARAASVLLLLVFVVSLGAPWLAPADYDRQFRGLENVSPGRQFLLGTDDLGRDRFSRLLYGSRISLVLASAAALVSVLIAAFAGAAAGLLGGWWDIGIMRLADLFLSLPWLFLFLTARAMLPLNAAPALSIVITFALMGFVGWAYPATIIRAAVKDIRCSGFVLAARACGVREIRLLTAHVLPRVRTLVLAQFWISIPVFILGETSLGLLGLGVSEPLPSWGNLLRELESASSLSRPVLFAPIILLLVVMICFQLIRPQKDLRS